MNESDRIQQRLSLSQFPSAAINMRTIILTIALLCGNCAGAERLKLTGRTMGTYYSVVVDTPSDRNAADEGQELQKKIEGRLRELNRQMSTWDPKSEISKFNDSASTDWVPISAEFLTVVTESKRIYELTDGAFDPTVAPLIDLWGFGDDRRKSVPNDSDIEDALNKTGMHNVSVRKAPAAIRKKIPELELNLSAIAKGFAVDELTRLLQKSGEQAFIVDIGGETRCGRAKQKGGPWRLGIESALGGPLQRVLPVTEVAVATSGDYRNFFQVDGVTYSHAINPRTGRPVKNPPAAVSVMVTSCMTADALATGLMVVGADRGTVLAKKHGWSVLFQTVVDTGSQKTIKEQATNRLQMSSASMVPFIAAAAIFLVAVLGMAIGTILQKKSLKGSCGGLASMPGGEGASVCDLCSIPKDQCTNTEVKEMLEKAAAEHSGGVVSPVVEQDSAQEPSAC